MWAVTQIRKPDIQSFIQDARDYCLINGLVLRFRNDKYFNSVNHAPVTLFPSPFPRRLYNRCLELQPVISKLMLKIANDHTFIHDTLNRIVQVDDFTKQLLDIDIRIQKEGRAQDVISCINRSDYMLHDDTNEHGGSPLAIRQVEVNAIASGMSTHSHNTKAMHKHILNNYDIEIPDNAQVPENESLLLVAQGIIDAYDSYENKNAYVLMIVEAKSINFSDQYGLELMVTKTRPDIKIIRRVFSSLATGAKLGPNKELLLDGNKEIALIYFRYGYDPCNYDFPCSWDLRLLLERSRAIKCPSINFHLSGVKKFQQVLNSREQLERFLEPVEAEQLSGLFCKIWSIEANTSAGNEGFQVGLKGSQSGLVLKPQREGGGHNIFADDISPFLKRIENSEERSQYILMEYINSPKEKNCLLLSDDDPTTDPSKVEFLDEIISELGIFGSILANGNEILSNKHAGYLVRSKKFGVHEGGVASGFAGLGSLILVDDEHESYNNSIYYH